MKIVLCIASFVICVLINLILDAVLKPFGIRIGFGVRILLYAIITPFIAAFLCIKWDAHKIKNKATKEGKSEIEYVQNEIPSSLRTLCEELRGNEVALNSLLDDCIKKGTISKAEAVLLLQEYMDD